MTRPTRKHPARKEEAAGASAATHSLSPISLKRVRTGCVDAERDQLIGFRRPYFQHGRLPGWDGGHGPAAADAAGCCGLSPLHLFHISLKVWINNCADYV